MMDFDFEGDPEISDEVDEIDPTTGELVGDYVSSVADSNLFKVVFFLAVLPALIYIWKLVPNLGWYFHIDRILEAIFTMGLLYWLMEKVATLILILAFIGLLYLLYGTVFGEYGFKEAFVDYVGIIQELIDWVRASSGIEPMG